MAISGRSRADRFGSVPRKRNDRDNGTAVGADKRVETRARDTSAPHRSAPDQTADVAVEIGSASNPRQEQAAELGFWTDEALCTGKTELFFAQPGERDGRRNRREALAKAYCACCPVQQPCLLAGRMRREHGVWGGENDEERAAAGFGPPSPHRRAVAKAAREARKASMNADRAS